MMESKDKNNQFASHQALADRILGYLYEEWQVAGDPPSICK